MRRTVKARENGSACLMCRSGQLSMRQENWAFPRIWHRNIPYRESRVRWLLPKLGESGSESRLERLREGLLCLCDEVCRYHREGEICDITFIIGLRIFKVHPVESRQPRPHPDISGSIAGGIF